MVQHSDIIIEGDGPKEKYRVRKDRPKGWSEFALLNRIREEDDRAR